MKHWYTKSLIGLILTGAAIFGYWQLADQAPPQIDGGITSLVRKGDISVSVTAAGTVYAARSSKISAPYNGYVKELFVETGDRVNKGDPLISIAESTYSAGEGNFPIRAPFNGVVVDIGVAEGEEVRVNTGNDENSLLRIEDFSSFYISAYLPEMDVVKVKKGLKTKIKISALVDQTFDGIIDEIALASRVQNQWNEGKVVFRTRIRITEKSNDLRPGMSALADVVAAERQGVLLLSHEFIEKNDDGYWVTLENGARTKVEIGLQNEVDAEIIDGLTENAKVHQVDFLASGNSEAGASNL